MWWLVVIVFLSLTIWNLACGENKITKCDVEMFLDSTTGDNLTISSPGYPDDSYLPGKPLTWCLSAPETSIVTLFCDQIDIPKSADCKTNALVVSSNNNHSRSYCGTTPFRVSSELNEMIIKLHSSKKSRGGKFSCQIEVEVPQSYSLRAIVYEDCECGYSYKMRIVGGVETGINEFPFMAGLVDARRGATVVCGATIISQRYVVTADHCLGALVLDQTAVLVGEHSLITGSETSATKLIRAKRFIPYPYYNSDTRQYDITLIELVSTITYSARVGPACLPFVSRNWDLTGQYVTVLGWGTTEFGGPRSKVLQKANLDLINMSNCINSYGSDVEPYTQLCAYRENTDACQYDSGGPLVYFNYYINRYELAGIVSYGRGCASGVPSVNTKVAPFLQWILDNTPSETYCYKSQ